MKKKEILPQIYSSGIFKLKDPLTSLLSETMWYTCIALRKIEEIEALGIDCYHQYYKPINLSEDIFRADADFNATIITLKSASGDLVHFPSTYLAAFPNGSGVLYSVMGIAFDIGALPIDYDLTDLDTKLKEVILHELGVNARSRLLSMSNVEIISQGTHKNLLNARKAKINSQENPTHQLQALKEENKKLKEKLQALETYAITHQESIKGTPIPVVSDGFTP